ncbi:MAG: C-terminal binding protein [Bacteroidetes bacterium]|nr:C-terminal binding protein [Bacteroidota bacterium]
MKVVITDYIEADLEWEKEEFKKLGLEYSIFQMKHASPNQLVEKLIDADIIIVNMAKMNREVLSKLNKCKLIIRHGVGYDNIDIKSANEFNITVSYIPDYCTEEVAEQALMLLLVAYRKFVLQSESMKLSIGKSEWDFSPIIPIRRFSGKTAGLIGCGRIGQKILKMLRGFDINVLVYDPLLSEKRLSELGVSNNSLEDVLSQSDMISIHSSLNLTTYHMIGEKELRMMKPESIIVNTARGGIINADALAKACKEKWIAGAGIDVYEKEPPANNFPLVGLENVILTPHISWYSEDAGWDIRKKIMEDVLRFIKGQKPRYPVSL